MPRTSKLLSTLKELGESLSLPQSILQSNNNKITVWYRYRDKQVVQWNRIEDPEMNPHTYGHLIFENGAKTIQWNKDSIFNKWFWFNRQSACRSVQIDPFLSPCTRLMFQWIKDLHIKPDTLNLIEVKVGKSFKHTGNGEISQNRTPMAYAERSNRQMGHHKIEKPL